MTAPPAVPAGLAWWRTRPGGAAWLGRLPALVAACAERWEVAVGPPFEPATIAYVAPARRADGTPAVLKLSFPEPDSEHEGDALAHWAGTGAVRLLAADPDRRALLLERCEPGVPLWTVPDEARANTIAADVLRRLWRPPPERHRLRPAAAEARRWRADLREHCARSGRPVDSALLERAVGWIDELLASPGDAVMLHQDLHGGNVLRAAREPWLAIDPKPLVGDRELDVASLLRDRRPQLAAEPAPAARLRRRLDTLTAELGLDRERARRWGVVHALAWGIEAEGAHPDILACAQWLSEV